jgi:hypothetical protein
VALGRVNRVWLPCPVAIPTASKTITDQGATVLSEIVSLMKWHDEIEPTFAAISEQSVSEDLIFHLVIVASSLPRQSRGARRSVAAPFFIIDEPEQHLHPGVQRDAARSLRDLVRTQGVQALLITHAVPFVNQGDALLCVTRAGATGSTIRPCVAEELSALGEIASVLGLDRGQLLADVSVFLFVEGQSDQLVLEGLFRNRLRQHGIIVVPLQGAMKIEQVIDSQILLRYSTAKTAVLLDNLDPEEIARLWSSAEDLKAAVRDRKTEVSALARLLVGLKELGRPRPATLAIPAKDIFDLLDEDAIRKTFRELNGGDNGDGRSSYLPFPGHRQARAEHTTRKNEHWKQYYAHRFGMPFPDVTWYARVADRMRVAGVIPPVLEHIVEDVERLAL